MRRARRLRGNAGKLTRGVLKPAAAECHAPPLFVQ
jgi:hypothetical protein